jgi:hypothetical protein
MDQNLIIADCIKWLGKLDYGNSIATFALRAHPKANGVGALMLKGVANGSF